MNQPIDVHHSGPVRVSMLSKVYPCIHAMVKCMGRGYTGKDLDEVSWQHLAARIAMQYNPAQLNALEEEAKVLLPQLHDIDPMPFSTDKRPASMSADFDKFGFFIAQEL